MLIATIHPAMVSIPATIYEKRFLEEFPQDVCRAGAFLQDDVVLSVPNTHLTRFQLAVVV
jgi:hypothetical protein